MGRSTRKRVELSAELKPTPGNSTVRTLATALIPPLLLCLGLTLGAAAREGFRTNGSMTEGGALPSGWDEPKTEEGPGRLVAARDTQVFKEGPASLRLATEGGAAKGNVSRALPEVAGQQLAVTGWIRAEGALGYNALAFLCPGAEPSYVPVKEFRPSPSWQRVNAKVKLPDGGQPPLLVLLIQGEGRAWLDELAVLPGDRFQPSPVVLDFAGEPLFSFLSWEKKASPVEGGLHLRVEDSKGGMGFGLSEDLSTFAEWTPRLTLTVNEGSRAKAVRITLRDADETAHEYAFKLDGVTAGATVAVLAEKGASVTEPGSLGDAGKQAGFDIAHVATALVQGDWSSDPLDVTFKQLELVPPPPEILAPREKLRLRLAAEAEQKRKVEAERGARIAALLESAPHPADGPDIRHVAPGAPDILALWIQEKEFVPVAQIPYEPKEGDEIRHTGKESVLVVEGGQVKEALKQVVVVHKEGNREVKLGDLAINAERLKPDDKVIGQDLTAETVDLPAAYRIVGVDDPTWTEAAAPTQVWWKRKPDAPRSVADQVEVFLKLPKPLTEGRTYRLEFPGVNYRQASVDYRHEPAQTRSAAVHVSAIGYRPDDPFKRAFLSVWLGTGGAHHYPDGLRFQLLDDASGKPAFTGEQPFHDEFRATTILTDPNTHAYEQLKAVRAYARLPEGKGDPVLRKAAREKVLAAADNCLTFAEGNGFGVTVGVSGLPPMGFVGYLSTPETCLGAVLPDAWLLTGEAKYLAGAVRACQFSAGANPMNLALTTGLGPNAARFPLHIDSYITAQPALAGITVYGISDPAENYAFDSWAYTWFLQKMVPAPRIWPTHESYWDIYVVPSTNEFTIHQTIIPTAFYWGFLTARPTR